MLWWGGHGNEKAIKSLLSIAHHIVSLLKKMSGPNLKYS